MVFADLKIIPSYWSLECPDVIDGVTTGVPRTVFELCRLCICNPPFNLTSDAVGRDCCAMINAIPLCLSNASAQFCTILEIVRQKPSIPNTLYCHMGA
jgi:hypothetical protein